MTLFAAGALFGYAVFNLHDAWSFFMAKRRADKAFSALEALVKHLDEFKKQETPNETSHGE